MVPWEGGERAWACKQLKDEHNIPKTYLWSCHSLPQKFFWFFDLIFRDLSESGSGYFPNLFSIFSMKFLTHTHSLNALHKIILQVYCIPGTWGAIYTCSYINKCTVNVGLVWLDLLTRNSFYNIAIWKMWKSTLNLYWPHGMCRLWLWNKNSDSSIFPTCLFIKIEFRIWQENILAICVCWLLEFQDKQKFTVFLNSSFTRCQ